MTAERNRSVDTIASNSLPIQNRNFSCIPSAFLSHYEPVHLQAIISSAQRATDISQAPFKKDFPWETSNANLLLPQHSSSIFKRVGII